AVMLVLSVAVTGCSDVKDMKFTDTNREEVIDSVFKSSGLTDEEKQRLTLVIGRAQASGESLSGKTVGELLEEK
ncbi:MAG TPA: hypothetical protein VGB23_08405, partial [Nitrospirota bacterium]